MDSSALSTRLTEWLGLRSPPVAIAFRAGPPPGVPRIATPAPSGCSYWRLAAEGAGCVFYTEAPDHHGCPVGAHTHGIDLPEEKARELSSLVETMVGLEYLRKEEVASLPRRSAPFGVAVYAPLALAPCPPDVVLLRVDARQAMLAAEASAAADAAAGAGAAGGPALAGRPTCAAVPVALPPAEGGVSMAVASVGCIGNRVYTGLPDSELYFAVPGPRLGAFVERLEAIVRANRELESFHRARAAASA